MKIQMATRHVNVAIESDFENSPALKPSPEEMFVHPPHFPFILTFIRDQKI